MRLKILATLLNIVRHEDTKYKVGKIDNTKFIYQAVTGDKLKNNNILIAGSAVYNVIGHIEAKVIVFDEHFNKFDNNCKKFIIYHELGHLDNHFTDEILASYFDMDYYDRLKLEHEADMNGVKNTSVEACIKTLDKIKEILDELGYVDHTITDRKILLKARAMKKEE